MKGEATNNFFGANLSSAGDLNGDGYSDVIVGASEFNTSTGKVYVFNGSAISFQQNLSSRLTDISSQDCDEQVHYSP